MPKRRRSGRVASKKKPKKEFQADQTEDGNETLVTNEVAEAKDTPTEEEDEGEKEEEEETPAEEAGDEEEKSGDRKYEINRAPVLVLWSAVVAHREGYDWDAALGFGKSIAALLAQSKGRSLGVFHKRDTSEEEDERKKKERQESYKIFAAGFQVLVKDIRKDEPRAIGNDGRPVNPSLVRRYLLNAFGDMLPKVQKSMEILASSFPAEEIGDHAYALYEKFRPEIPPGLKGWGKKGTLDLNLIESLAQGQASQTADTTEEPPSTPTLPRKR